MILRQRESRSPPALNKNPDHCKVVGVLLCAENAFDLRSGDLGREETSGPSGTPLNGGLGKRHGCGLILCGCEALAGLGGPGGVGVFVEDLLEVGLGLFGHVVGDVVVGGGEPAFALAVGGLDLAAVWMVGLALSCS